MSTVAPRVVAVTRATEFQAVVAQHGTREQARFFLERSGRSIDELEERHRLRNTALETVLAAVPQRWRRAQCERADLSRFVFGPEDVIVVVGQDGLVANVAKYLDGQPVVGVNPDPKRNDGVLVPHAPARAAEAFAAVASARARYEERTMVVATTHDGQRILALNEIFVGHRTHQSARYRVRAGEHEEAQSSSGIIVATGTGATGWARSIARQRTNAVALPAPQDPRLAFFVREPFPSVSTSVELDGGLLEEGRSLVVRSEMDENGTVFGDGIETDRIVLAWGESVEIAVAKQRLRLLRG